MTVVGAEACPDGWFVTVIEDEQARTEKHQTFEKLSDAYETADRILVDISSDHRPTNGGDAT